jgi:hypothetical protein
MAPVERRRYLAKPPTDPLQLIPNLVIESFSQVH